MSQPRATAVVSPQWFSDALAKPLASHYFSHHNRRLHYLHWKDVSIDSHIKPALVFLHGFRGHAQWWRFIAPSFLEKYQVYALDFSGMGDSEHCDDYDKDTHAGDIIALIEHLGGKSVTAVAHSYGGGRVIRAASQRPELFEHIIAIDSYVSFPGETLGDDPGIQSKPRFYPTKAAGLARFRLTPTQAIAQPYIVDHIAEHSLKQLDSGEWTWKFDSVFNVHHFQTYDADQLLAKISCPIDYVYGSESIIIRPDRAQMIMDSVINKGRLIEVPEGHHHLMVSHPVATISLLRALL